MLFWNIRRDARASSWQGAGATLVALIAATRLPEFATDSQNKTLFSITRRNCENGRFVLATYTKLAGWHRAPMRSGDSNIAHWRGAGPRGARPRTVRVHYWRPLEQSIYLLLGRRRKNTPSLFGASKGFPELRSADEEAPAGHGNTRWKGASLPLQFPQGGNGIRRRGAPCQSSFIDEATRCRTWSTNSKLGNRHKRPRGN